MTYLYSYKASYNEAFSSEMNLIFFNDSNGVSMFNMSGRLKTVVNLPTFTVSIKTKENGSDDLYKTDFLKPTTINVCKAAKGVIGNYLVAYALSNMKNHTNVTVICPFQSGFYYAENFPVMGQEFHPFVPSFFKGIDWELTLVVKGKAGKKQIQLSTWKIYGASIFHD